LGPQSVFRFFFTYFISILSLLLPPYLFRLFWSFFLPAKVSITRQKKLQAILENELVFVWSIISMEIMQEA